VLCPPSDPALVAPFLYIANDSPRDPSVSVHA
jgi:hypothetical protein